MNYSDPTGKLSYSIPAGRDLSSQKFPPNEWILDAKERAKIHHKQKVLHERAIQIHKGHKAKLKVNKEMLQAQMNEKIAIQNSEVIRDRNYEEMLAKQDNLALVKEFERNQIRENDTENLKQFWNAQTILKESRQAEEERGDRELGYHLKFTGEDLQMKERMKYQQSQLQNSLLQQINDNQYRTRHSNNLKRQDEVTENNIRREAEQLIRNRDLCKQLEEKSTQKYNEALARLNQRQADETRQMEDAQVAAHISHLVNSTLMTEDPAAARSVLGPHRVLTDRWKGMSKEQKDDIHQKLKNQILENQEKRDREMEDTRCWANLEESQGQTGLKAIVERESEDRQEQKQLVEDNGMLAREQARRNKDIMMNRNWVSEEFFQNFGIYPR